MVNIDSTILPAISLISATIADFNAFPISPNFDIRTVAKVAETIPTHSWEFGTSAEAQLELYNPELSVFGATPFPVPSVPKSQVRALNYAANTVDFGTGYSALAKGDGSAGDPASLGVSAVMLGKTNATFADAAQQTVNGLLQDVPRFWNGAISHRADVPQLWADFMYMVPPFLAYYAADTEDLQLLQDTVRQCELYRQILQSNTTDLKGVWMHVMGTGYQDTGLWSTGNAWAAAGMTRQAIDNLTQYIKEIVDGAMTAQKDGGLLRNYLDNLDSNGHGFGEISGSSLLASAVYRMAVLQPQVFSQNYVAWADSIRMTITGNGTDGNPHITSTGIATPAVNPMAWQDTTPFTSGSPEGQAFIVLMYAGWRDCVKAGQCSTGSGALRKRMHGGLHRYSHLIHGSS
ncbi:hypothetical protein BDZ97DRAFT_1862403 [Flammula alnicola]|nr:hypothetical protein BDZ97DRAFT_1862403 [Flammula alnicola]